MLQKYLCRYFLLYFVKTSIHKLRVVGGIIITFCCETVAVFSGHWHMDLVPESQWSLDLPHQMGGSAVWADGIMLFCLALPVSRG